MILVPGRFVIHCTCSSARQQTCHPIVASQRLRRVIPAQHYLRYGCFDETDDVNTTRSALVDLSESYHECTLTRRLSVLDLLEKYPEIQISLTAFLQMLPAMRLGQYSNIFLLGM
jgi:sulfite reductase alpha subunit-like flavoprotein